MGHLLPAGEKRENAASSSTPLDGVPLNRWVRLGSVGAPCSLFSPRGEGARRADEGATRHKADVSLRYHPPHRPYETF
ncbi:hypothetical protein EFR84_27515 [Rhizobium chutanense]|uniref:Uncharacterized protein n=1 Tax=Rhizobium chutanense TaxID=2035448 RepID=A0A432NI24_9HYPH|nr:hypothetical protein EFR84_27515 [Rhizobium chutanense]